MYIPKLFQVVFAIFGGDPELQQMRNDTITLLNQIIEEAEDSEVSDLIRELCEGIATALSAKGRQIDPDSCYDMLYNTVMEERAKIKARLMMTRMFKRRRRRGGVTYEI